MLGLTILVGDSHPEAGLRPVVSALPLTLLPASCEIHVRNSPGTPFRGTPLVLLIGLLPVVPRDLLFIEPQEACSVVVEDVSLLVVREKRCRVDALDCPLDGLGPVHLV